MRAILSGIGWPVVRLAGVSLVAAAIGRASGEPGNPFLRPAGVVVAPAAARLDTFELTGLASAGTTTRFCVMDRATNRSQWLVLGEPCDGLIAVEFDRARDAVRLQLGDESRWVGMRTAVIAVMALPTRDHGAIDWAHLRMSDQAKAREAEAMVTDILEIAQEGRAGRLMSPR